MAVHAGREEQAPLGQIPDYPGIGLLDEDACPLRDLLLEIPLSVDGLHDRHALTLAGVVVIFTVRG